MAVFHADEPSPFQNGGAIQGALTDDAGNVLLDTNQFGNHHVQVFVRARLPAPEASARLAHMEEDTAQVTLAAGSDTALGHTWRVDEGEWQPLGEVREIALTGLLPGKHVVEVRAFNAELTPGKAASVAFVIAPMSEAQFSARLRDLSILDLDIRETAARKLKSQGPTALPRLREARQSSTPSVQWWIDAIIQHIERQPPK